MKTYASPSPRFGGRGGAMARVLPPEAKGNAKRVRNLDFPTFGHDIQRPDTKTLPSVDTRPVDFMASRFVTRYRPLSRGVHGETFVLDITRESLAILRKVVRDMTNVLQMSSPRIGTRVVVKVSRQTLKTDAFVKESTREAAAHVYLWKYPSVNVGSGRCVSKVRARDYTPRFYMSGIDLDVGIAMSVMEFIDGSVPLKTVQASLCAHTFMQVERALLAFLASGVEHADVHFDNVLVKNGHPYIIDFGFALKLPERIRKQFIEFAGKRGSSLTVDAAIRRISLRYTNAIQYKRFGGKLSFYNPTHAALRVLWKRMPESQRKILEISRQTAPTLACMYAKYNVATT